MPRKISKAARRYLLAAVRSPDFILSMLDGVMRRSHVRLVSVPSERIAPGLYLFTQNGLISLEEVSRALHVIEPGTPVTFMNLERLGLL